MNTETNANIHDITRVQTRSNEIDELMFNQLPHSPVPGHVWRTNNLIIYLQQAPLIDVCLQYHIRKQHHQIQFNSITHKRLDFSKK